MSNEFKDIDMKTEHTTYLLYWICDDKRFKICKN